MFADKNVLAYNKPHQSFSNIVPLYTNNRQNTIRTYVYKYKRRVAN